MCVCSGEVTREYVSIPYLNKFKSGKFFEFLPRTPEKPKKLTFCH